MYHNNTQLLAHTYEHFLQVHVLATGDCNVLDFVKDFLRVLSVLRTYGQFVYFVLFVHLM